MDKLGLFQSALGIGDPWQVTQSTFDSERGRLDIYLDFAPGSRFPCPEGDQPACPVHDAESKSWRHLDFFQHQAYLTARVPRVRCTTHGVRQVTLPWARAGSGFTLLFEALLLEFAPHMPVAAISRMVDEHDTRIWRVLEHYVDTARAGLDMSQVSVVGVDETSARRGHDYVSLFMDLAAAPPRVLYATEGRDAATVQRFCEDLADHGGDPARVNQVCCDMSPAFIKGITEHLPEAKITFDRYHVIAQLNTAVDEVRKQERRTHPELAGSKYLWLKRPDNLSERQTDQLAWLNRPNTLATARAYRWRWDFDAFYQQPPAAAEQYLESWCKGAIRSRLEPIKKFVRMVRSHWEGIVRWHQAKVSNGILEGTNSLIQAAKRKARGYRSKRKMITIIYLIAGRLPLPSTHTI